MKNINLKEVRRFIENHQYEKVSSADIIYSLGFYAEIKDKVNEIMTEK